MAVEASLSLPFSSDEGGMVGGFFVPYSGNPWQDRWCDGNSLFTDAAALACLR